MLDLSNFSVKVDKPYPEVVDAVYSPETIRILKDLNTSCTGEFFAITSYVYQFLVLEPVMAEVANLLEDISIVEMHHFELIGAAIVEFGGNPTYTSGSGQCFTCRCVDTTRNARRMIENDIKAESDAIADYTAAATRVSNQSLSNLFLRIAQDEMLHKRALEGVLLMMEMD